MAPRENLRSGFTTGACAAAAARGALLALLRQEAIRNVTIRLPGGQAVRFALHSWAFSATEGYASVIKDAGDDPDVTDKAEICARVTLQERPGVTWRRGVGVGLVTKKGLPIPPGEPAINPAPRLLIADMVHETLIEAGLADRGVEVEISVPRGEELAKKTFNPRLGIVGGISILGTTGIVVPYSTAAWLASVVQGIDVAAANGHTQLILVVGARGERLARQLWNLPEEAFIEIGPFFGDTLRHCAEVGIRQVVLCAMIGKLAKFAAGHESVHSTSSSQDFAFLASLAEGVGASAELVGRIRQANTAQEVSEMVAAEGLSDFFAMLCQRAWQVAERNVQGAVGLEIVLFGAAGEVMGHYPAGSKTRLPA